MSQIRKAGGAARARLSSGRRLARRATEGVSCAVCYIASMGRTRAGKTRTTSFSLDEATLRDLRALAGRRHKGNVSALLAEFASREAKFAAAEAFFEKYGVVPLDEATATRIEASWGAGVAPRKARRRAA